MRLLFLTKRIYTGKDLLIERYGRLYELPVALRSAGHEVLVACLSYYPAAELECDPGGGVTWRYWYAGRMRFPGVLHHYHRLADLVSQYQPEVVIGASDAIHAVLAHRLARRFGLALILDLCDNFESYPLTRLPGLLGAFRRAVRAADGLSVVSTPLRDLIADRYGAAGRIAVIENAVPTAVFRRGGRIAARSALGLPVNGHIIGTAGTLYRARGVEVLYEAFKRLSVEVPGIRLALAGRVDRRARPPEGHNVHYFGHLAYQSVPLLFNALDVGVIYAAPDRFGHYCFPQKAYEMLACGIPIVAARVGALAALFAGVPDLLYEPGEPDSLAKAIKFQIEHPVWPDLPVPDWTERGRILDELIRSAAR